MSHIISVLTKIPNLTKELRILAPNLFFKDVSENDNQIKTSNIILADFDLLIPHINSLTQTIWIQGTWAGVENVLPHFTEDQLKSIIVSRFSGKHFGRLMSEYVVANIINYERNLFSVYENKKQKLWSQDGRIKEHRSIAELCIGVLGIGNIGNYIAQMLHTFGAKIWGFGKRNNLPNTKEYMHYEEYCTRNNLQKLLENCDYIVNVLPSTSETIGLLNGDILRHCSKKQVVFINIGRGNIIYEKDLINALNNKWLFGAILDVFENEPLSSESPLWDLDQVFITPHVSGVSRARDIAEQFMENYSKYQNGEQIPTQLFYNKNY